MTTSTADEPNQPMQESGLQQRRRKLIHELPVEYNHFLYKNNMLSS